MKIFILAVLGFLSIPAAAFAQDEPLFRPEWRPSGTLAFASAQEVNVPRPVTHELTLGIRVPFLGGDFDKGKTLKWNEVYSNEGGGFEVKYSALFRVSPNVSIGPYAGFALDVFGGKTIDVDPGTGLERWDVDPLVMIRIVFGVRAREQWGAFFMDQNIGIGPVIYSAGTAQDSIGFDQIEIVASTAAFLFEVGLRFGAVVSPKVDLGLGMNLELNGAPDAGQDLGPNAKLRGQANFVLTFLINLNF
jgi:hypothetical protein